MTLENQQVLVDASTGWDRLGAGLVTEVTVVEGFDALTGSSLAIRGGVWDPLCLRWHELGGNTASGSLDRRMSFTVVNDYEGPYTDPLLGAAPFGQVESITARNRSTRERDLDGRVAIPASHRRVIDSEDGRFALALTMRRLEDAQDAPPSPPEPLDDPSQPLDPSDIPDGVRFLGPNDESEGDALGSVRVSTQAVALGGITIFGRGPSNLVRRAIQRGVTDVAQLRELALAAAQGKNPQLPERTRERGPSNSGGSIKPLNHPAGYVWSDGRIGLLGSVWDMALTDNYWFVGSEFTPIGPLVQRHDSLFGMPVAEGEEKKAGAIKFAANDASDVTRGGEKLFKGELWWDPTEANNDSAQGGAETGKWVVVVGVDFPTGNDIPPPPPPPPPPEPPPGGDPISITPGAGKIQLIQHWHEHQGNLYEYLTEITNVYNESITILEECCDESIKIGDDPIVFPPTGCVPFVNGGSIPSLADNTSPATTTVLKAGSDGNLYSVGKNGSQKIPADQPDTSGSEGWSRDTSSSPATTSTGDDVTIEGKLTVTGLIDPTGLVFSGQSSAPWTADPTIWALLSDGSPQWHDGTNNYEMLTANTGALLDTANTFLSSSHNEFVVNTSGTTDTVEVVDLIRRTTGTAGDGLAGRLMFSAEDSGGTDQNLAWIDWGWDDVSATATEVELRCATGAGLKFNSTTDLIELRNDSDDAGWEFDGTDVFAESPGDYTITVGPTGGGVGTFTLDVAPGGAGGGTDLQAVLYKANVDTGRKAYYSWELWQNTGSAYAEAFRLEFPSVDATINDQDAVFYGRVSGVLREFQRFDASAFETQFTSRAGAASTIYPVVVKAARTTPGVGLGSGVAFEIQNAASAYERAGLIGTAWTDITAGAEYADLEFSVMQNGAAASRFMFLDGSASTVSFDVPIVPTTDNNDDLGATGARWQDLWLSGDIKDGTDTWTLPTGGGTLGPGKPKVSSWEANTQTLTGSLTLTDSDETVQLLDPDSTTREVILPTASTSSPFFLIVNTGSSNAGILRVTISNRTVAILGADEAAWFITDGTTWYAMEFTAARASGARLQVVSHSRAGVTGSYMGLFGSSSGDAGNTGRNEFVVIDSGDLLKVTGVGTNSNVTSIYKNGSVSEQFFQSGSYYVHATSTAFASGDDMSMKDDNGSNANYTAWMNVDTDADGYVYTFCEQVPTANDFFTVNGEVSTTKSTADEQNEVVVGEAGALGAFTWWTNSADTTTDFVIYKNGSSDQTVDLTGAEGTKAITATSCSSGDDLAVRYTAGTSPSVNYSNCLLGYDGDDGVAVLGFGGDTNGNNGRFLWKQGASTQSTGAGTSTNTSFISSADFVTLSLAYRTEDTTQTTWKVHKNGAADESAQKGAADAQGVISLSGTAIQAGDEIEIEVDANEASGQNVQLLIG